TVYSRDVSYYPVAKPENVSASRPWAPKHRRRSGDHATPPTIHHYSTGRNPVHWALSDPCEAIERGQTLTGIAIERGTALKQPPPASPDLTSTSSARSATRQTRDAHKSAWPAR